MGFAILALALVMGSACARQSAAIDPAFRFDAEYPHWGKVLARYASDDGVSYVDLSNDPSEINIQVRQLQNLSRPKFESMSRDARLAFLINAHNVFAIHRIAPRYPVKSIEKTAWIGSALKKKDIRLIGRRWSLRSLRDEIMGPSYYESRSIFLLNWGMKGCAPLTSVPVTEPNLEQLLEMRTRHFFRKETHNWNDRRERTFHASRLLKEYRDEFERDFTSIHAMMQHYLDSEEASYIALVPSRIRYTKFDTSLNDSPPDRLVEAKTDE